MRIERLPQIGVRYVYLGTGEIFEHDNELYIVIDERDSDGVFKSARLRDGRVIWMDDKDYVVKKYAKVVEITKEEAENDN